jgi:hypothetical protein
MLSVTRVAGRPAARSDFEIIVEFSRRDGVLAHQIVVLRAAAMLADARRGTLMTLARSVQALEPATLGLVPEAILVQVLTALAATVEPVASTAVGPPPPARSAPLASILDGIGDLQKAGPSALQAAKSKMEIVFESKRVLPGDPAFVYDKRATFSEPQDASDWD